MTANGRCPVANASPPDHRCAAQYINIIRLSVVRAELARPLYRGSAAARELAEQLAGFDPGELSR